MRKSVPDKASGDPGQRVLSFIRRYGLVSTGQKLVVAVSGGPDSVCLFHILLELRHELGIELNVAHLDHGLRGAESQADARYVAGLARRAGVPATIAVRDVAGYRTERRISLEEAAREVRYAFLAQAAKSVGAERVAVGHNLDDHLETLLMHLIRGSGTGGLRGLLPLNRLSSGEGIVTVVRPLLELTRAETAEYCRRRRLKPRLDASNLSVAPLRNRIRHQLLPLLKEYNPGIEGSLARTARIAADDMAFIEEEVSRCLGLVASREKDTVILNRRALGSLHPALKRYVLRAAINDLLGTLRDIEACHIEAMLEALDGPAGKKVVLPGGLVFSVEYDRCLMGADPAVLSPFPALEDESGILVPGKTTLQGWDIEASILDSAGNKEPDGFTAYLDLDIAGRELTVRCRRPGDRFQPLGMNCFKKLNEFMIDARIPRVWRKDVPIVCSGERILWIVGWRIDERVKVTSQTKRVLRLVFRRR